MKILISESSLENLIVNRMGIDLWGKILKIDKLADVPKDFIYMTPSLWWGYYKDFNERYLIKYQDKMFLYFGYKLNKLILGTDFEKYSEAELMEMLNIPPIGLTVKDLIDVFAK